MESDWRMNVWSYGINDGYTTLAAPVLDTPGYIVTRQTRYPAFAGGFYIDLGGDLGWQFNTLFAAPPDHPHFPFGLPVDPD